LQEELRSTATHNRGNVQLICGESFRAIAEQAGEILRPDLLSVLSPCRPEGSIPHSEDQELFREHQMGSIGAEPRMRAEDGFSVANRAINRGGNDDAGTDRGAFGPVKVARRIDYARKEQAPTTRCLILPGERCPFFRTLSRGGEKQTEHDEPGSN
jgi:hypothetical protein